MAAEEEHVFQQATQHHKAGRKAQAIQAYRQVLRLNPKHPDALHMLGVALVESALPWEKPSGTSTTTTSTTSTTTTTTHLDHSGHPATRPQPGQKKPPLLNAAQVDEGMRLLRASINCKPSDARYRRSLGVALQRQGHDREALEAFEFAVDKDPSDVVSLQHQARLLKVLGRPARAAEVYLTITKMQPQHPTAHYSRACLMRQVGRHDEAVQAFRQHLAIVPGHQEAKFWIAALTGDAASAPAAPSELVAGLFDSYADNFDSHLVTQLGYKTPWVLMDALLAAAHSHPGRCCAPPWLCVVDLGCGTGLMGPLLAPHMAPTGGRLEGVDLSAGMVAKAGERGCYQHLAVADLVTYLKQALETNTTQVAPRYSLFIAADVFVYVGDLRPVLEAAAACAQEGALFAFSTELLPAEGPESHPTTTTHTNLGSTSGRPPQDPTHNLGSTSGHTSQDPNDPTPASSNQGDTQQPPQQAALIGKGAGGDWGDDGSSIHVPVGPHHMTHVTAAHGSHDRVGYRLTSTGRYQHNRSYLQGVLAATGWEVWTLEDSVIRQNSGKPVQGLLCVAARCI